MTWYCYWSPKKEATWRLSLASERSSILTEKKAEFITALDIDQDLDDPNAEMDKTHYTGPYYIDFDSEDINETIAQFKLFLNKLVDEFQVDLSQIYLYASGKKGFHIEIPQEMFISKPSGAGYRSLPAIYKEMAYSMYVDTLDLAVYTARKGRMWRTPNFPRPELGTFKVQITAAEAMAMTEGYYRQVVAIPRPLFALLPPKINTALELEWSKARDKVEKSLKRKANKKRDTSLLARFEGEIPPTLLDLMRGKGIKEGAGFQNIAMQLAIAAHGLGLTCEYFLTLCEGLCENHVGDGSRYRSQAARRSELARMWNYMEGNPTYDFSASSIRSLVEGPAADLMLGEPTDVTPEGKSCMAITLGMSVDQNGIYKLSDEGHRMPVSPLGLSNFRYLLHLKTGDPLGYDVDVYVDGKLKGERRLTMDYLASKSRFQMFVLSACGAGCQINDNQINGLAEVIRKLTLVEGKIVYVVNREGMDVVKLPSGDTDIIWIEGNRVLSRSGESYAYINGMYGGGDMPFKTDLMKAPRIPPMSGKTRDDAEYLTEGQVTQLREDFYNLLRMNSPETVAKVLGWTVAAFFCGALRHEFRRFPLLHLYGPSGAGKTTTLRAFTTMHYHKVTPLVLSASNSTAAPLNVKVTGTSSIPVVIDEYKPAEMSMTEVNRIRGLLRDAFDGNTLQRGRLARESGDTHVVTQAQEQTAPVCFMAEQMETQKAIVQRSIVVSMSPQGNLQHEEYAMALGETPEYFGSIGRLIVESLIFRDKLSPAGIAAKVREYMKHLKSIVIGPESDRPIYSMAVAATGIHLLRLVLGTVFAEEFDEKLLEIQQHLLNPSEDRVKMLVPTIKAEILQVFSMLSHLSHLEEAGEERKLINGSDYGVGVDYVEVAVRKVYSKYRQYSRSLGETPLYSNSEAFLKAIEQYDGAVRVVDSALGAFTTYRLDMRTLYERDGVEQFKD